MRILTLTILLLAPSLLLAQQGRNLDDHVLIKMSQESLLQDEQFVGSPYLSDEFVNGAVYSQGGVINNVPLRYNIYKDYFEFKKNEKTYILDASPQLDKVTYGSNTFMVEKYLFRGAVKFGYLNLLDSGKGMLFSRPVVSYKPSQPPKPIETEGRPASYSKLPTIYYYKIGDGQTNEIKSLKSWIQSFPDKQNELTEFADKEKISVKRAEDLVQLVKYYNSL